MDDILSVLVSGLFKSVELLKDLKNAPAEILELAEEIEILSGVLVQFEEALESAEARITETNKQQNEYKTGKNLVKKIQKTMDKMILHRNMVSMAAKDDSLPQKLLAWLRWLSVKPFVAAAGHAIQRLSTLASLFLNSVVCKNLAAQIAEKQRNRAEVPPMLCLKLKVAM
ncbi:hypothetical protein BBO_09203 [Beauveria brongniartii RCEF 3172]|uniref:Uncharacterized protein n=1 Tax=Beauveria brongniartii RCEF 3172 TaxID=1081107 RepID=A0A166W7T2_9HYPO|nr:hypothetical protein BBO_09203 [Beauveria brongniartii RCEF 3172]